MASLGFMDLHGWRFHNHSLFLLWYWTILTMRTFAPICNQIFLPLNLWLWPPVISKHTFVSRAWLHVLHMLPLGSFRQQQDLNSLILMLNRPRSVSLSSDVTFSNPSSILAALHWTCSRMSTSFFLIGSPSADTVVQMWFYQCPKGEGSFPRTYQLCSCYHHPGRCWPPPQEGAAKSWVTHGPPEPSGPSLQSCSLQLSPSLYWCTRCIPAHTEEIFKCLYWIPGSRQLALPADRLLCPWALPLSVLAPALNLPPAGISCVCTPSHHSGLQ